MIENTPLHDLSAGDLRAIGEAIDSGRLKPPFTKTALQRYCVPSLAAAVAEELQNLINSDAHDRGTATIAHFLRMLADERARRWEVDEQTDLVWSGPEGPGAACRDTAVVVRELFTQASQSVLIAGYAVHQGREIFRALAERMQELPNLEVRMFLDVHRAYTETSLASEILRRFARHFVKDEWPGERLPKVFYDPRSLDSEQQKRSSLHAKCIVVDGERTFVSSANFTEAAQVRNIEVGVLIRSARFAAHLTEQFESLTTAGLLVPLHLG